MDKYSDKLINSDFAIAVWGCGYIGLSTMCSFAQKGVKCIGYDVNDDAIKKIKINPADYLKEYKYWQGFDFSYLFKKNRIMVKHVSEAIVDKENILVHFLCVPTEKNGIPHLQAVDDVIDNIISLYKSDNKEILLIVESTLIPGTAKKIEDKLEKEAPNIQLCISPRRDWFDCSEHNLENLERVCGAVTVKGYEMAADVLSIVCKKLIRASDYQYAELTKTVENAYRHLDITFANQLTDAFPHLDIREVLRLASTKWNVGYFYPSIGTGGYCIPLSSKYILAGTEVSSSLGLLRETVKYDDDRPIDIADILMRKGVKKIGILGLSYKHNMKVEKSSPSMKISEYLSSNGVEVYMNDPYYNEEELKNLANANMFDCFDYKFYKDFDAVILSTDHRIYNLLDFQKVISNIVKCKIIVDNTALWSKYAGEIFEKGIDYSLIGSAGWRK